MMEQTKRNMNEFVEELVEKIIDLDEQDWSERPEIDLEINRLSLRVYATSMMVKKKKITKSWLPKQWMAWSDALLNTWRSGHATAEYTLEELQGHHDLVRYSVRNETVLVKDIDSYPLFTGKSFD